MIHAMKKSRINRGRMGTGGYSILDRAGGEVLSEGVTFEQTL